jgi:hypothetical protein
MLWISFVVINDHYRELKKSRIEYGNLSRNKLPLYSFLLSSRNTHIKNFNEQVEGESGSVIRMILMKENELN